MIDTTSTPLAALTLAMVSCDPVGFLPGGALSGELTAPPSDWSLSDAFDTVQLETRRDARYSVNVLGVAVGPHFYVGAANRDNRWARHVRQGPRVRLRIGNAIYVLRADPSDDAGEMKAVREALLRKYDAVPTPAEEANGQLFRLVPRECPSTS